MTRTKKRPPPNPYRKESKPARVETNRKARKQAKRLLRAGKVDTLPGKPKTEGRITW